MAKTNANKSAPAPARTNAPQKQPATLEMVLRIAPTQGQASAISSHFGLDPVDADDVREITKTSFIDGAKALQDTLQDQALKMHYQRIVGAMVSSAHGAATFYGQKVTAARDLTSALANDARDEDRDGPAGFETKAARAREFAAKAGLAAYALLAAAQGAAEAYEDITGDVWKAFTPAAPAPEAVSRKAAAEQMGAFG